MNTYQRPTSIKVIFWVTQFLFWLFSIAAIFSVVFSLALMIGLLDKTQLHVGLPIEVNLIEKGVLNMNNTDIQVEFKEMQGKIHFVDAPRFIGRTYSFFIIFILSIVLYIFNTFRSFIKNVYNGQYFDRENIFLLKRISYGLLGAWVFAVFYAVFQYFYIVQQLQFQSIEFTYNFNTYPSILAVALLIWVLSHILLKGVELQEDNQLTI